MNENNVPAEWKVGEFISSARRPAHVLMLAVGEKQIAEFGAHPDFIRWHAAAPVAQPPATAEAVDEYAPGWNINNGDTKPFEVASPTLAAHDIVRAALATPPAPTTALPPVARTQADEPRRFEAWCEKRFPLADADEDSDSFFRALYAAWCAAIGIEASTGEQSHG